MAQPNKTETGTAFASPKPPEKINWITEEDAEKLAKAIGRQYTKKDDDESAKKFFFKIISMNPYQPGGVVASEEQCRYQYQVQKYHRNKFVKGSKLDDNGNKSEYDAPMKVESHALKQLPGGRDTWVLLDGEASFFMDTEEFKKQFVLDTIAD